MIENTRSTLDELFALSGELHAALDAVLDQSEIDEAWRNTPGSGVVFVGNPYAWRAIARESQSLVGKARKLGGTWEALTEAAVRRSAPSRLKAFRDLGDVLREVVDQSSGDEASGSSVDSVRKLVADAIEAQRGMLADLPSAHGSAELVLVPDTNSVVYQPALEDWQ